MTEGSNDPKVLVEFTAEEIKWLADRLYEEWGRTVAAKAVVAGNPEKLKLVEDHQKMERVLRNRLLDNASNQGFGDL